MESLRPLIQWCILPAWVWLGTGCTTLEGWKTGDHRVPPIAAPTPPAAPIQPAGSFSTNQSVASPLDANATSSHVPRSSKPWSGVNKLLGREKARPVAEVATAWRNKIEYLPNPAANGAMQPGLAGQVFLYTAEAKPAVADGSLIVDLIDETPRPPGVPPLTPERWEFKKDVLKNLRTLDERFGECYVIFLPWPTYRPDVTHIRLRVRYEPDGGGFPIYAPETRLILGAASGSISDVAAAGPSQPRPESPTGPGLGVFRFGGESAPPGTGTNPSPASRSTPTPPRWRVLEITPPARSTPAGTSAPAPATPPPATAPSAVPGTPSGNASSSSAPEPPVSMPPGLQPARPVHSPAASSPSDGSPVLPPPPLVPGPLPE